MATKKLSKVFFGKKIGTMNGKSVRWNENTGRVSCEGESFIMGLSENRAIEFMNECFGETFIMSK